MPLRLSDLPRPPAGGGFPCPLPRPMVKFWRRKGVNDMIPMSNGDATKAAVELAKALCQASGDSYRIDKDTANQIADFIETMEYRLTHKESETVK